MEMGQPSECCQSSVEEKGWSGSNATTGFLGKSDSAISSRWFWSYLDFIILCAGAIEELSSWAEGCECHGHTRQHCVFKGRRSPELATGVFSKFLKQQCALASSEFLVASAGLDDRERGALMKEWQSAMEIITTVLRVKTAHWKTLPWILGGVASGDEGLARAAARRACDLFAHTDSPGRNHPLSAKFLADGPLRDELEMFLGGVKRADLQLLRQHLGALSLVRVVERQTEGMHRDIKNTLSRSPNASLAYISTELRAKHFSEMLSSPDLLEEAASQYDYLTESVHLSTTVASFVGGPGVDSWQCLS